MKYLLFLLSLFYSITIHAQTLSGKVVRIADGDSFTLLTTDNKQVRIRLYGIDCPENGQPYSKVAKEFTGKFLSSGKVVVQRKDIDRYQRIVGIVIVADSFNLNESLLKAGLAWHYKSFDKNPIWAGYENEAKMKKLGLWQEPNVIAPWDWRKGIR
ncbi:MAG: hypothetical protein BGO31_12730 [Bacteroidetes bacterium 43-16]|nr:MAG: hypothetical protein BGO31_12730 [Bacteroidetes bacterium 43-16]